MKITSHFCHFSRRWVFMALILLTILIFLLDTILDYALIAGALYLIVILLALRWLTQRGVISLAILSCFFIGLSLVLSVSGNWQLGIFNAIVCIITIIVVTYLGLELLKANAQARHTQAQLIHLARIKSLGELSSSLAHELNQPLTVMLTSAETTLRWLNQQPPQIAQAQDAIERVITETQRMNEILLRVRRLAANKPPIRQAFNINQAIIEVAHLAQATAEQALIKIDLNLDQALPSVIADRIQIQQVLSNLLLNAIEAVSQTKNLHRYILISSAFFDSQQIIVSVSDSGPGFDSQTLAHLFDAFYSTKNQGLGLGLTISRTLIEMHQGQIEASSLSVGGACVTFTLPID